MTHLHRRWMLILSVGLVLGLLLAACGADEPEGTVADEAEEADDVEEPADLGEDLEVEEAADDPDAVTIGFISHTRDITDLFGQLLVGFQDRLDEAGFAYELITGAPRASDDHEGMDRILDDLRAVSPEYLVFGPSSFELNQPRLVDLEAAGTTIIMTDYPPPDEGFDIDPITWVIYDHYEMGQLAGYTVANDYCDRGVDNIEVALFWGPAASEISQDRGAGVIDGLEEATEECGITFEIVEEVHADFNREMAYNLAETVITANPNLDVLVGMNSNTALGIMEALSAGGQLDNVDIVGMGGQIDELAAICRGDVHNAPYRDPRDMGALAADALMHHHEGNLDEIPELSWTDMPVLQDCDDVFEVVPRPMLEVDDFRDLIDEDMWQEE